MSPELFIRNPLKGALQILPATMDSPSARAMILAICLQESKLQNGRQVKGPARGYAQFEQGGGVTGVLTHPAVATYTKTVCASLDIVPTAASIYAAIEYNDVLTAALTRLLLWTLPQALPTKNDPDMGWAQYLAAWRPGKPHRETWNDNFAQAWAYAEEDLRIEQLEADAMKVKDAAITLIQGFDALESSVKVLLTHQG